MSDGAAPNDMASYFSQLRFRLKVAGLWPQSRVARIACYFAGMGGALFALETVLGLFAPTWKQNLGGWVIFLLIISGFLFAILGFRLVKQKILWRLRNRLIVTYVFIGVIPAVLLVAMALITLYGFAGQFAIFVFTSQVESQLHSMEAVNAAVSNELAGRLERGETPTAESLAGLRKRDPAWGRRRVCAWYGEQLLPLCDESKTVLVRPGFLKSKFREITQDHRGLHLRVASTMAIGGKELTVITSEPFDKDLVGSIAANLGEITLISAGNEPDAPANAQQQKPSGSNLKASISVRPDKNKEGLVMGAGGSGTSVKYDQKDLRETFTVGELPAAINGLDREIMFPTPLPIVDWSNGNTAQAGAFVRVRTRPSVLYGHLFAALGVFVQGVEYILLAVGAIFALIELIALIIGTRMTRTVTAAVANLYEATQHIDRGDFSHRIPVRSTDQLSELSRSFNTMTASIEKLILEQKEKQRLENELVIAQEVQAQLFPRQVTQLESLEVHGFCRPARTVSGDYYDFLTASSQRLILAVGDISGKGISAALLMATIHSAVRAYSVEGLPAMREAVAVGAVAGSGRVMAAYPEGIEVSPAALLSLLNHQLYESTPPEKYATMFLGIYDGRSHRLTYSNGGHLPPILVGEDGRIRRLEAGGTVIGLFDNMTYGDGSVEMEPGEIFLAYSDGITEPENEFGEFGEERLIELVRESRHLPLAQISQAVTAAVDNWIGENEQPDDVTLVLARAR